MHTARLVSTMTRTGLYNANLAVQQMQMKVKTWTICLWRLRNTRRTQTQSSEETLWNYAAAIQVLGNTEESIREEQRDL